MYDIYKASQNLEDLELHFEYEGMKIDVQWFRIMHVREEWCIERHTHSFFEFHFIRSGKCRVVLDNGEFVATEGTFYVNAPGIYHKQLSIEGFDTIEYCLGCYISWNKDENNESGRIFHILNDTPCMVFKDILGLMELFEDALEEAYSKRMGFFNKISNIASILLINSVQIMSSMSLADYSVPLKSNRGDYRFLQIDKFINDNISTMITVKQIADYLHLSEKQITRIVRLNCGISTKELIIRKKVHMAAELIKNTSLPVNEISDAMGFSSEYYFSQYFKKFYGESPSYLRKTLKDMSENIK
jgi:AraC-type DNA-binding domain-containing proteins